MDAADIGDFVGWMSNLEDIPKGWVLADGTNGTLDAREARRPILTLRGGVVQTAWSPWSPGIYPIQKMA